MSQTFFMLFLFTIMIIGSLPDLGSVGYTIFVVGWSIVVGGRVFVATTEMIQGNSLLNASIWVNYYKSMNND